MQESQNYSPFRRLFLPFSGEEPLSRQQSIRVIVAWALVIPFTMALLTVVISLLASFTLFKLVVLAVLSFLSGVLIFGLLGVVVVMMTNRSARLRQAWKARQGQ